MKRQLMTLAAAIAGLFALWAGSAWAQQGEVLWLGQATTRITSAAGTVVVIDPFLKRNPKTPEEYKELAKLGKVDVILITHGHFDHVADLKELAAMTGAKVVGNGAMAAQLVASGAVEQVNMISMNKGGTVQPAGEGLKIHMVPAEHSSGLRVTNPDTGKPGTVYAGESVGYVVELEDGFKIYHSGDTGVFGDMALIDKLIGIDLALVSIGGHFTMDPKGAAYALTELLKPDQVLPIHYGTFPPLKGTPAQLKEALGDSAIEVLDIQPGQAHKL